MFSCSCFVRCALGTTEYEDEEIVFKLEEFLIQMSILKVYRSPAIASCAIQLKHENQREVNQHYMEEIKYLFLQKDV